MINPMRSQPVRLMGMSSGMDTQSIIDATLRMHQFRIDNQLRNRRLTEWRQQTHNGIRDEIQSLRQTFLSNLGSKSMMSRNAFNANIASSAGRNSDAVTLRALTGSQTSAFSIGQITQLARGARATTSDTARTGFVGIQGSQRLDQLASGHALSTQSLGFSGPMQAEVRVGNQNVRIDQTDVNGITWGAATNRFSIGTASFAITHGPSDSLNFTVTRGDVEATGTITFNEDGSAIVNFGANEHLTPEQTLEFTQLSNELTNQITRQVTVTEGEDGEDPIRTVSFRRNNTAMEFVQTGTVQSTNDTEVTLTRHANGDIRHNGANLSFFNERTVRVNETDIVLRSNMTINQMTAAFNNSEAGVRMSFESLTGRFSLETTTMGRDAVLNLGAASNGTFFDNLGFVSATADGTYRGQNAELYINGDLISTNSNSLTFGGVAITLNRTTDGAVGNQADTVGGNITVNVTRDTTNAIARIREFIDGYNAIIARLEGLLNERKTGNEVSYRPLTDEEKRSMTDRQIEDWENIARKGIMRSDQGIQNLVSNLRRSFFEEIENMGVSASQIGLSTGSHFDGTGGQIMIDEERLRAALEADPDRVADIFIKIDDSGTSPRGVGLLHKVDGLMRDFVNNNQSTTLRNLEDSIKRTNEQIARMEQRMWADEDRLHRQFAAMESALSQLQQQGDWFGAMLGGR